VAKLSYSAGQASPPSSRSKLTFHS
jgi:hypothetical protein